MVFSAQFRGESAWPIVVLEVQDTLTFHPCSAGGHTCFWVVKSAKQFPDSYQACPPRRQYMNGRVLSDIGRALYVVATSVS